LKLGFNHLIIETSAMPINPFEISEQSLFILYVTFMDTSGRRHQV